jgi:hypothetical protein
LGSGWEFLVESLLFEVVGAPNQDGGGGMGGTVRYDFDL